MTDKEIFDSLVKNALDFLNRALDELEKHPKYALIDFAAAVELVFKARLVLVGAMWVAEEPTDATAEKFAQGKVRTVTLELARKRIESLTGDTVDSDAFAVFRGVARHRNRVMHFFHTGLQSTSERQAITGELFVGWYHLHRLVSQTWGNYFPNYLDQFSKFGARLHASKPFFDAVFSKVVTTDPRAKEYSVCPCCGYMSLDKRTRDRYQDAICRVCGFIEPSHKAIQHGEEPFVASCGECEGYQTVNANDFGFKCSECGQTFSNCKTCEFCGEHWVGVAPDYGDYFCGCEFCGGAHSRIKDD